eukprot:scaffold2188_cov388-Prasinococcus_capsulatus_cf.AAC.16
MGLRQDWLLGVAGPGLELVEGQLHQQQRVADAAVAGSGGAGATHNIICLKAEPAAAAAEGRGPPARRRGWMDATADARLCPVAADGAPTYSAAAVGLAASARLDTCVQELVV